MSAPATSFNLISAVKAASPAPLPHATCQSRGTDQTRYGQLDEEEENRLFSLLQNEALSRHEPEVASDALDASNARFVAEHAEETSPGTDTARQERSTYQRTMTNLYDKWAEEYGWPIRTAQASANASATYANASAALAKVPARGRGPASDTGPGTDLSEAPPDEIVGDDSVAATAAFGGDDCMSTI